MRCQADPSIRRVVIGNFQFPLGAYPVEDMTPKAGYTMNFESADGGGEGEYEEWPDRYAYDVVVSAERVPALARTLFSLFEGRVYPILDVLGQDDFREIDPFIAYELVGMDRVFEAVREYGDFLHEDGMCGFGAMCEEPFLYVFVDEHKILTIRTDATMKDRIERALAAFDLESADDAAGADSAAHEHRSVLVTPEDRLDLLSPEEIIEKLKDAWRLLLNVDPDVNLDDEGKELGATHWRAVLRCDSRGKQPRYAEVLFDAHHLRQAEELAFDAMDELAGKEEVPWEDASIVAMDRLRPEKFKQVLANTGFASLADHREGAKGTKSKAKTPPPKSPPKRKSDGEGDVPIEAGRVYSIRWVG